MKPLVLIFVVFVVAMAFGIALGLSGWQSASVMAKVDLAIAVWFGGTTLFCFWHWNRAKPGSADRLFLHNMMMLSATQWLWITPRMLWPDGGWLRAVFYVLAISATTGILIRLRRQRRRPHTAA